jgi:outer membrane lipoprotein-sorting protein
MFKLLISGIAFAFITLAGTTQAQLPPASTTPPPQSQTESPPTESLTTPQVTLLTKAIGKFWQTDRAETKSEMVVTLRERNKDIKVFVSVKTIAKVGYKFRSNITLNKIGEKSKITYTIVSDGNKTWIYRPDRRQYTQISSSDFYENYYVSIIGMSSIVLTSVAESTQQEMIADISSENSKTFLKQSKEIRVSQQQIDGRNLYVYTYAKDPGEISGFVHPQTEMVQRIEFKLGDENKNVMVAETIISRNSQVAITDKTFTFSPPKGVKKVKSLRVEPFN